MGEANGRIFNLNIVEAEVDMYEQLRELLPRMLRYIQTVNTCFYLEGCFLLHVGY